MKEKDIKTLMNLIGCLPVIEGGYCTEDNLAIALATYFEEHPDKPENAKVDDETGWSDWAIEKTDDVLRRIVECLQCSCNEEPRKSIPPIDLAESYIHTRQEPDTLPPQERPKVKNES